MVTFSAYILTTCAAYTLTTWSSLIPGDHLQGGPTAHGQQVEPSEAHFAYHVVSHCKQSQGWCHRCTVNFTFICELRAPLWQNSRLQRPSPELDFGLQVRQLVRTCRQGKGSSYNDSAKDVCHTSTIAWCSHRQHRYTTMG